MTGSHHDTHSICLQRCRYGSSMLEAHGRCASDFRATRPLPFCTNAIASVTRTSAIEMATLTRERRPPYKFAFSGFWRAGREANGVCMSPTPELVEHDLLGKAVPASPDRALLDARPERLLRSREPTAGHLTFAPAKGPDRQRDQHHDDPAQHGRQAADR